MMLSQFAQALADAKCSVQLDANFVKGYIRVSKCCVALGDAISAQQAIEKALQIEPINTAALNEKVSIQQLITYLGDYNQAYQAKDYRKALFCLDRALAISSASRQLKISRAECLAFLGRYGEAQEVANDILRLDNINADAIYVRGLCLYNEDNVDKAFTHFQQVLRLAPDHTKAKEIYKKAKQLKQKKEEGNLAFKSGKLEDAYTLYSEALQIDPCNKYTNAKLFFNRATVAAKLKKLKESIQDCTSALELDEKYFKAVLRRAKSYMDLEMFDEAVRDYELANKMDRGNQEVRQLLQQAKLELKKSKRKDYYKILGVSKDANDDDIKKAYRKRALVHHPDRHSSASEDERKEHEKKFKEIGEAYGVLSDAKKRTRYDQGHDIDDLEGHGHGFSNDIDPNQIFQAFFSQGGGGAQHFTFGGQQGGMPGGFSFQFG
jgi:DnaJ family protein C protein 7